MNNKRIIPIAVIVVVIMLFSCSDKKPQNGNKEITRIWLSYNATEPQNVVINWYTSQPSDAGVDMMAGDSILTFVGKDEHARLHHVQVPLTWQDDYYRYRVRSGNNKSKWYVFRGITDKKPVRIVVMGDWGFATDADMSVILREKPALIVTAGDNIQGLFLYGKHGDKNNIESYLRLIDSFPDLFRTVPFMPAPGNHDKQLYPRGKKPPVGYNLYDTNAVAFTKFFELPGKEWMWAMDVPATNLRFLILDLNHIHDHGTTWQSCHSFGPGSEQYNWYKKQIECNPCKQLVTVYNSENKIVRKMAGGIWEPLTKNSDIIISGSGYFAEYAIVGGTPYLNSSLIAGDLWSDPVARYSKSEASYVLITATRKNAAVELKRLKDQSVIYRVELPEK